jgi:hypothetical protein
VFFAIHVSKVFVGRGDGKTLFNIHTEAVPKQAYGS